LNAAKGDNVERLKIITGSSEVTEKAYESWKKRMKGCKVTKVIPDTVVVGPVVGPSEMAAATEIMYILYIFYKGE
jgi:hypothetical protein